MVVFDVVVVDPEFDHANRVFRDLGLVTLVAAEVEVDVAVHRRVDVGHQDALDTFGAVRALMLGGTHALDDLFPARVAVQACVQLTLGNVVFLDDCLLCTQARNVLAQHADAARLHQVRMDALVDHELDERGVVAQRPCNGLGENLVCIGVGPLVVEGAGQHWNLAVLIVRHSCAGDDRKACGFSRIQKARELVDMRLNLVVQGWGRIQPRAKHEP